MFLSLYFHTLRYLRPVQIGGRFWHRLNWVTPDLRPAPPVRSCDGEWVQSAARQGSMLGPDTFRFLHVTAGVADWDNPLQEKLWRYNLHYFDDLNAKEASDRGEWHNKLLRRWVAENPPGRGTGWEPYPTSLRLVNWIKWTLVGNVLPPECRHSLAVQARWLSAHLEWHLLGNHLFANAKALVFAGMYFGGAEAAAWLTRGLSIIDRELSEQVLADGGNFERSPMYHAIFLEDVLDLINLAESYGVELGRPAWRAVAGRMLGWLVAMCHPDGEIGLFNDAALGIAPSPTELIAYADRLGIELLPIQQPAGKELAVVSFPDSGYVRLQSASAVVLLDVAPIGPDYLPGHAHADTLSFEMSLHGQRLVVNGGTSRYGLGDERQRERGTAAHSTVTVADTDSSEVWAGFRVARRAYPFDLDILQGESFISVSCAHDGYCRLSGRPVHRRQWAMETTGLRVADTVEGGNYRCVARYVLHPSVTVNSAGDNRWHLALPGGQTATVSVEQGKGCLTDARFAPEFGRVLSTACLAVELDGGRATTRFNWN